MGDNDFQVVKIQGNKSGKTLAIFGGVHGDEPIGPKLLNWLKKELEIDAGIIYLVYANKKAIKQNVRFTEKNLNRCFLKTNKGESHEDRLALDLQKILDSCDALLDIHAFSQPDGQAIPFVICEEFSYGFIQNTAIPFVLSGIHDFEQGSTDQYMFLKNKPGICVELGAKEKVEDFFLLGQNVVKTFLAFFGAVSDFQFEKNDQQIYLKTTDFYRKKHDDFKFSKKFKSFDLIKKGEEIAFDGGNAYVAKKDSYIIFPREDVDVGVECFVLATKKE